MTTIRKVPENLNQEWSGLKDGKAPPKPFEQIFINQYVLKLVENKLRIASGAASGFMISIGLNKLSEGLSIAVLVALIAYVAHLTYKYVTLKSTGKKLDKEYEIEIKTVVAGPKTTGTDAA